METVSFTEIKPLNRRNVEGVDFVALGDMPKPDLCFIGNGSKSDIDYLGSASTLWVKSPFSPQDMPAGLNPLATAEIGAIDDKAMTVVSGFRDNGSIIIPGVPAGVKSLPSWDGFAVELETPARRQERITLGDGKAQIDYADSAPVSGLPVSVGIAKNDHGEISHVFAGDVSKDEMKLAMSLSQPGSPTLRTAVDMSATPEDFSKCLLSLRAMTTDGMVLTGSDEKQVLGLACRQGWNIPTSEQASRAEDWQKVNTLAKEAWKASGGNREEYSRCLATIAGERQGLSKDRIESLTREIASEPNKHGKEISMAAVAAFPDKDARADFMRVFPVARSSSASPLDRFPEGMDGQSSKMLIDYNFSQALTRGDYKTASEIATFKHDKDATTPGKSRDDFSR